MAIPPNSYRFCVKCNRNRIFSYQKILGHSCCTKCGSRFAKPVQDIDYTFVRELRNYLSKRKEKLIRYKNQEDVDSLNYKILSKRNDELNRVLKFIREELADKNEYD